jgi:hypothetical protein
MASLVDPFDSPDYAPAVKAAPQGAAGKSGLIDPFDDPGFGEVQAAPVAAAPSPEPSISTTRDVVKSVGTSAIKAPGAILGLPSDAMAAVGQGFQYLLTEGAVKLGLLKPEDAKKIREIGSDYKSPVGSESINETVGKATETVGAPLHKAQTGAGKAAGNVADFVFQGGVGAGSVRQIPGAAVKFGLLPGMVSEGAGQATEGTALEPYARVGGALVGGGIGAVANMRSAPGKILSDATKGVTDDEFTAAQRLIDDSRLPGRSPVTLPEALQQVTNGRTGLADVQRVVEQSRQGGPIMRDMMADRASNNAGMVDRQLAGDLGPLPASPYEVAPRVQAAAETELTRVRQGINDKAKPFYDASRGQTIPDADFAAIQANPSFQAGLKAVRNDPILGPTIADLPDNAVGVIDAIKKQLDDMGNAAGMAGERFRAGEIGKGKGEMLDAADTAAPDYATARQIGAEGRQTKLNPLERAPTGQLAEADTFGKQSKILFDPNPLPGSERQIREAVASVVKTDPVAAQNLVNMKIRQSFEEATQNLASGPAQFGGPKFVASLTGNGQQRKNLEAAVKALPDGQVVWEGFNRMLNILEAQGRRQAVGSQTEFNKLLNKDIGSGGVGDIAALMASPGKWWGAAQDAYQQFRYGKNTELFANLFTSPEAVRELRKIAQLSPGNPKTQAVISNLIVSRMAYEHGNQSPAPVQ